MKNTLVETVGFSFTAPIIAQLSSLVDETEPGVEKALHQSVPLVLNGLTSWVGQGLTPDGLLDLVREAEQAHVLRQLSDLSTTSGHERGTNLLLDLLGDGYRGTVNRIAVEAGIRPTASGTLLQVAATAVVGVLGQIAAEHDLPAADFVYWLRAQKAGIATAMLPVAGTGPAGNPEYHLVRQGASPTQLAPVPAAATWADQDAEPAAPTGPGAWRWQWGALLLLAVCLGYFFGHNRFGPTPMPTEPYPLAETRPDASPAPLTPDAGLPPEPLAREPAPALVVPTPARPLPRATTALAPLAAYRQRRAQPAPGPDASGRYDQDRDTYIYDTGRPIVLTLADGTTQKVGANSTENRLYTFLASPAIQVDSVNRTKGWINFDRINFETGKALLTPESAMQLGNIASILATFPQAVVKIGGYTDSTGDALANFQLSEDRARAAMRTLAGMGVSPDRLQAKGYGPKYFVKPNNTPIGRSLNRRVSIRVVSK